MDRVEKCQVCEKDVKINKYNFGKCKNCGWIYDEYSIKYPNAINPPNFVSLNQARKYILQNKKFTPTYDEFIKLIKRGLDMSFSYNGKKYQIDKHENYTLWEIGTDDYQEYDEDNIYNKLSIDGILLKDIWQKVSKLQYEC